jgi:tRNA A-37 threonylcarbamoyl transferase component Bud32
MKYFLLSSFLCAWACGAATAEDLRVTFRTSPEGAEVRVLSAKQERKLPGVSGVPVILQEDWLKQPRLEVEFRLDGYQTWSSHIPSAEFRNEGAWPAAGQAPVHLSPVASTLVYFFLDSAPSGAKIYLTDSSKNSSYLGLSGTELTLDKSRLTSGPLNFRLEREGYDPAEVVVLGGEVQQGARLPARGAIRMFQTWSGWLQQWGACLAAGAIAVAWALSRRRRRVPGPDVVAGPPSHEEALAELGYTLHGELGRGGMAVVYRAEQVGASESCALKLLHRDVGLDEAALQRMRREIKILRGLQHRNIVKIYDFGEVNGQYYLVMEMVQGETLKARMQRERVPLAEALRYAQELLAGVAYAHSKDIVHRDLKPDNVMLRSDGGLRILDFGISRSLKANTFETMDDAVLGTPAYMAPERFSGVTNAASDQYALGLIFYELLTGVEPMGGEVDIATTITRQLFHTPPPPSEHNPQLSPLLDRVVMRMLEKEPQNRFGSVGAAADALAQAVHGPPAKVS